jgi:hypothetical protein
MLLLVLPSPPAPPRPLLSCHLLLLRECALLSCCVQSTLDNLTTGTQPLTLRNMHSPNFFSLLGPQTNRFFAFALVSQCLPLLVSLSLRRPGPVVGPMVEFWPAVPE